MDPRPEPCPHVKFRRASEPNAQGMVEIELQSPTTGGWLYAGEVPPDIAERMCGPEDEPTRG